jgi:hypothetical protein
MMDFRQLADIEFRVQSTVALLVPMRLATMYQPVRNQLGRTDPDPAVTSYLCELQ